MAGRLLAQWSGWPLPCYCLETGGNTEDRRRYPTLALMYRVWDRGKGLLGLIGFSSYSPFWRNQQLPELYKLEGFSPWMLKGIYAIHHLQLDGALKSFDRLREDFSMPHAFFYQYLQPRHAYAAQSCNLDISVQPTPVLDTLLGSASTKGVISTIYKELLFKFLQSYPIRVSQKWAAELGPISEQQWDYVLGLTPQLSPSEAQRFSQLMLIHRVYRSPAMLHNIGVRPDSCCPRCSLDNAHILHMFWECGHLERFWRGVLDVVHKVHPVRIGTDPRVCVLGILEDLDDDSPTSVSISRMLFQARKLIAQHWLRPTPPSTREYINRINNVRLEKGVYTKRRATSRFETIWGPWLDTPNLPSQVLLRYRLPMTLL